MHKMHFSLTLSLLAALLIWLPESESAKVNIIDIYRKEVFDYGVLLNRQPVVVYFTAKSCTYCKRVQNNLESFAKANSDKMYVAIMDLDKFPQLKEKYDIAKIPTTRSYYKGQVMGEVKGAKWLSIQDLAQAALKTK